MRTSRILPIAIAIVALLCILPNPIMDYDNHIQDSSIIPNDDNIVSDGEPWLDSFPYRKYHVITGSTGAGTNYQVSIRVRSGSGTDSGDLVNLDSSKWSVTDPLRFTDDDGITLLDYWRESIVGNTATYWVEIKDSLNSDVMIYLYYGNNTAPSLSNGTNTFIAWDDFDTGYTSGDNPKSTRGWTVTDEDNGDVIEVAANPSGTGLSLKSYTTGAVDGYNALRNTWTPTSIIAIHFSSYVDIRTTTNDVRYQANNAWLFSGPSNYHYRTEGGSLTPDYTPQLDAWEKNVWMLQQTTAFSVTIDGNLKTAPPMTGFQTWSVMDFEIFTTAAAQVYLDNFFVTKWFYNEPQHDTWGPEETDTTPPESDRVPWLENFPYRRAHAINGSLGAGTNYQVEINVHSGVGTDSGNLVNLPSAYWTPSNPVRFTDNDGTTLLDYWKEWSDTDDATYWVEVKDNLDYDTVIYLYYGNNTQPSLSNGTSTFIFFDDFESGDFSKWDSAGSEWSVVSSNKKYGSYSAMGDSPLAPTSYLVKNQNITQNCLFHVWYYVDASVTQFTFPLNVLDGEGESVLMLTDYGFNQLRYLRTGSDIGMWPSHSTYSDGVWFSLELAYDFAGGISYAWNDGQAMGNLLLADYPGNGTVSSISTLKPGTSTNPKLTYMDDYYVRKWISSEPVHVGWSDTEAPTIDAPSDLIFEEGSSNVTATTITWKPTDQYPALFKIYRDNSLIESGLWNTSIEEISISVMGLSAGVYNYTCEVIDVGGLKATDYVKVTVQDVIAPTISEPLDISYNEGQTGNLIEWDPEDLNPLNYTIHRNEILIQSGLWNSTSENISIGVDGLSPGIYNYTLLIMDIGHNTAIDNVVVTVSDNIVPIVDSPADFNYTEGETGNQISWNATDLNPTQYVIFRNDIQIDSGTWNNSDLIIISIDGLSYGNYNFTIEVRDVGNNSATDTVMIFVEDGTPPIIEQKSPITYEVGTTGHTIEWNNQTDATPDHYEIYRNDTLIKSGLWNSTSENFTINIDGLDINIYNFTLFLFDGNGNYANSTVWVTVEDTTVPSLDDPIDIEYGEGTSGHEILWTPSDLYPYWQRIYRNGTEIFSAAWNGAAINLNIDGLTFGIHNYTLVVYDTSGNTNQSTVIVTVLDGTPPSINYPSNFQYESGSTGNFINWTPSDLHPSHYEVYRNGSLFASGQWNGTDIEINVDGLSLGLHELTLYVFDAGNNNVSSSVFVTVIDTTPPTIDHPADITFYEGFNSTLELQWDVFDYNPDNYTITRDGIEVQFGDWNVTSMNVSIWIGNLTLGTYSFNISIYDLTGLIAFDEVIVVVEDGTPPVIDPVSPITIEVGSTGNVIEWNQTDATPDHYEIYRDEILIKSGLWNSSSEIISIGIDGLDIDVYNFTLIVFDENGRFDNSTVWVTVEDTTAPTIDSPLDIEYGEGTTGHEILWTPSDLYPDTFQVFHNGAQINSTSWGGLAITVNVDGLPYGTHNFTLVVIDTSGNSNSDTVLVIVTDVTNPNIDYPSNIQYESGSTGNFINWTPLDLNPNYYEVLRNSTPYESDLWNTSSILVFIDGLDLGIHNFTIIVYDLDGNSNSSTVIVTVVDTVAPSVDHPVDIYYFEGDISTYEIMWQAFDFNPENYSISRNGTEIQSGPWNSSSSNFSISVGSFSFGTYTFSILLRDAVGQEIVDDVFVFVEDGTSPEISTPDDVFYGEGQTGYFINWTATDLHPSTYEILRNGTTITSGLWNSSGETISLSLEVFTVGNYNITIVVVDLGGNSIADEVILVVYDGTYPSIVPLPNIRIGEGTTGNRIQWNPLDLNPANYTVFLDGSIIGFGLWNSSADIISVSIDGHGLGIYNYTLVVMDLSGNHAIDVVLITVADMTPPVITHPSDQTYPEGETGHHIIWSPIDLHPASYQVFRNDTMFISGGWDSSMTSIEISIDGLGLGLWNYTIVVIDVGGNIVKDTVLVTVIISVVVTTTTTTTTGTTSSTSNTDLINPDVTPMVLAAAGGGVALLIAIAAVYLFKKRSVGDAASAVLPGTEGIVAVRGGEFVGNRFRFKVKISNDSNRVVTDVCVTLTSYPKDSLKLEDDASRTISKLEPKGFRSPTFEFLPTKDCVKGDLIATISWVDSSGQAYSTTTRPYTIRAVCDLLKPESITPNDFVLKLATLGHGETITKVEDWTPEEMQEKTIQILKDSNFFEVTSGVKPVGDFIEVGIQGWAKGMYTGKNLGIQITISGKPHTRGATCKVRVSGEDEAMILPAIDEVSQKLGAWLCPRCGGILPIEAVKELKDGKSVACPYCNVTVDR